MYRLCSESLDSALNVLARALENNKDNPEIWCHYLRLFSKRGTKEEVQEMCETAVEYAPDYQSFWTVSRKASRLVFDMYAMLIIPWNIFIVGMYLNRLYFIRMWICLPDSHVPSHFYGDRFLMKHEDYLKKTDLLVKEK